MFSYRGGGSYSRFGAQFMTEANILGVQRYISFTSGPNIGCANAHPVPPHLILKLLSSLSDSMIASSTTR